MTESHHSLKADQAERKTHYRAIFAMKKQTWAFWCRLSRLDVKHTDKDSLRALPLKHGSRLSQSFKPFKSFDTLHTTNKKRPKNPSIGGGGMRQIAQFGPYGYRRIICDSNRQQTVPYWPFASVKPWARGQKRARCSGLRLKNIKNAESLKKWLSREREIFMEWQSPFAGDCGTTSHFGGNYARWITPKSAKELDQHIRTMGAQIRKLQPAQDSHKPWHKQLAKVGHNDGPALILWYGRHTLLLQQIYGLVGPRRWRLLLPNMAVWKSFIFPKKRWAVNWPRPSAMKPPVKLLQPWGGSGWMYHWGDTAKA